MKDLYLSLAKMKHLIELNLSENKIDDKGCQYLAKVFATVVSIKILQLSKNKFGSDGCEYLSKTLGNLNSLEKLFINFTIIR